MNGGTKIALGLLFIATGATFVVGSVTGYLAPAIAALFDPGDLVPSSAGGSSSANVSPGTLVTPPIAALAPGATPGPSGVVIAPGVGWLAGKLKSLFG